MPVINKFLQYFAVYILIGLNFKRIVIMKNMCFDFGTICKRSDQ